MIINMNGAKAPETPSSVLQEKTVTPETLPTVIGPDEGYNGLSQVTVNPDSQLKAENIRSGKTIFGVAGVFEGSGSSSKLLESIHHYLAADGGYVDELNTSDLVADIGWSDVSTNSLMRMLQLGCSVKTLRVNDSNPGTIMVNGSIKYESGVTKYTPTKIICETTGAAYYTVSRIDGVIYGIPEIPSGGPDRFLAYQIRATIIVDGGLVIDDTHWFNNSAYDGGFYYVNLKTLGADGRLENPQETPVIHFRRVVNTIQPATFYFSSRFSVRFYADTPPALGSSVFSSDLVNLIVPKGKLETYQNASGWSSYSSKIVEANE